MTTKMKTVDWGGLKLKVKSIEYDVAGPGESGTEITATGAEINLAADISGRAPVAVTDAATYSVLSTNSGKLHVIPDLTQDTVISLPTAAAGLHYIFMYGGVAADAHDWIIKTGSDTNYFKGGVVHIDTNADAAGDEVVVVYPDGNSNSMFDFDTPQSGTRVEFVCDGTNWYINGMAVGVTAPTFADNA
jgi:hypothetical protein